MSVGTLVRPSVAGKMRSAPDDSDLPKTGGLSAQPVLSPQAPSPSAAPSQSIGYAGLQRLVDQAANFHVQTTPSASPTVLPMNSGLRLTQPLFPMDIFPSWPAGGSLSASRATHAACGQLIASLEWIPDNYVAGPGWRPPATPLKQGMAQRFVLREATISLDAQNSLRIFGAGRAFPSSGPDADGLMVGAVCDITSGTGAFQGLEGVCTLCGDLSPERGFRGHIMIRIRDPHGVLLTDSDLPAAAAVADPEPGIAYITWLGQKSTDSRLANSASLDSAGQLRGLNIPVDSKAVRTGWAMTPAGFRARRLGPLEVIGLEIGFGRESVPRSPATGNGNAPYQFEGVSLYSFRDKGGAIVGTLTANVLEGRSMAVRLDEAPGQPALRFGFFGPVICGTGCFAGARGMLYGSSGSLFNPPPLDHVISNWYVLRLYDPDGRFRESGTRGQSRP